jgi:hypothetical protein
VFDSVSLVLVVMVSPSGGVGGGWCLLRCCGAVGPSNLSNLPGYLSSQAPASVRS